MVKIIYSGQKVGACAYLRLCVCKSLKCEVIHNEAFFAMFNECHPVEILKRENEIYRITGLIVRKFVTNGQIEIDISSASVDVPLCNGNTFTCTKSLIIF